MDSLSRTDYTTRYVDAATGRLPLDQRGDHARELRSSIQDQIEARVRFGEDPAAAELSVLNGMGDPAVLAAEYADRRLHLIGPRWYPTWERILRVVLWSALPFVALGVAIGMAVDGRTLWGIIVSTLGVTLTAGAWIFTIVTIVFSRLDRGGASVGRWTVESLTSGDAGDATPLGWAERVVGVVAVIGATAGLVVLSVPWEVPDAGRMSVLNAALWPWSLLVGAALILAGASVSAVARRTGRWGMGSATTSAIITLVGAALIAGLTVAGVLFDPAFIDFLGLDLDARRVIAVCVVGGTVGLAGWSVADGFRRARRAR